VLAFGTVLGRWLVAILLLAAAADKLRFPGAASPHLASALLPRRLAAWTTLLPWLELVVGVMLALGVYWRLAGLVAGVLLAVFALVVLAAPRGASSCGCGGVLETLPPGPAHAMTNLVFAGIALAVGVTSVTGLAVYSAAGPLTESAEPWNPLQVLAVFSAVCLLCALGGALLIKRTHDQRLRLDRAVFGS
jgi:uncharacterized membrane protein YphA (DoxX/SURF4 family)